MPGSPPPPFDPNRVTSRPPARLLAALTLGVLVVHGVVLSGAPLSLRLPSRHDASHALTLTTRGVPAPAATRPAPAPRTPQRKHRPRVAAPPAPVDTPAEPRTDAASTADTPAPDTAPPGVDPTAALADTTIAGPVPPALAASVAAPEAAPPPALPQYSYPAPVRLKYDIRGKEKGFPYAIGGELLWQHDGTDYNARLEISHFLLGSRVQTSIGQLTPQGLAPTRFGDKFRSEVAAHFERSKNKVTFSANTPEAPLAAGAQDQLSVFMQIASMMAGAPNDFPPGTTLDFQAIGPRSSASWTFTVGDFEKLVLPGGEVDAVRLWRDPTAPYEPKGEIWLAPSMAYMPVRIRLSTSEDNYSDMQWSATKSP